MDPSNRELLIAVGRSLGIELGPDSMELFSIYLEVLKKWSSKMNLTGIQGERERVRKLLADSLSIPAYLSELGQSEGIRIADLGSGAGVPGLPVKISLPGCRVTLVESRLKRVHFLQEVLRTLGLSGIEVFHGRSGELEGEFDVITARAVGSLDYLCGESSRLLVDGGLLLAMRGTEELADSGPPEGWLHLETRGYLLPEGGEPRSLVILEKQQGST